MAKIKMFVFTAEELEDEGVEGAYDGRVKCGGCNWEVSRLYVLAENREQALQLIKKGEAGLCGDCMSDMLVEEGYEICPPQ